MPRDTMYNDPPVVEAARSFDVEGLRNLIEAGADLDARSDDFLVEAGGFVPYERAHRASLAAIFVPRFPQLPEEIVPRIVEFWAHTGFY